MTKRGRKSSASLSVISNNGIEATERPKPPIEITDEQACDWIRITNSKPASWWDEGNCSALIQHVRHLSRARRIAQAIEKTEVSEDFDITEYRALLKDEETQTRAILSGATKMRLLQQATYTDKAAGTASRNAGKSTRPWSD